jgi:hypothetical protein
MTEMGCSEFDRAKNQKKIEKSFGLQARMTPMWFDERYNEHPFVVKDKTEHLFHS